MGKPSPKLETALTHAAHLREQGEDLFYIGKCLLNFNYRMKYLNQYYFALW